VINSWSHTDDCGNTASHSQTITLKDTTPPVFSRTPQDETVDCDCDQFPKIPAVYALDNCDELGVDDVTVSEVKVPGIGDNYELIRTWTAVDHRGNSASHSQTITVQDSTAPSIIVPGGVSVLDAACNALPELSSAWGAYDNCDTDLSVAVAADTVQEYTGETGCAERRNIRTFIATDRSGNTATASQTVNVGDNEAPVYVPGVYDTVTGTFNAGAEDCVMRNTHFAQFAKASERYFHGVTDSCSTVTSVTSMSCTAPGAAPGDCVYKPTHDTLYVKGVHEETGRVYKITASVQDACGNSVDVHFSISAPINDAGCTNGSFMSIP
jgi:hypothetical protein